MKTNVYKPSNKKSMKKPKSSLNNKWFIVVGVILLAVAGIIAIRVSQAAGRFAQNCLVVVESGRQPETGTLFIEYEACGSNGTVYLRKSTNGEIRTAGFGDAEAVGMQMYEEMIAAQNTPAPTPPLQPQIRQLHQVHLMLAQLLRHRHRQALPQAHSKPTVPNKTHLVVILLHPVRIVLQLLSKSF